MGKLNKVLLALVSTGLFVSNFSIAEEKVKKEELEVISVTAQKRSQSIQDVPISITAFGDDSIEKMGAKSFADLTTTIPSVSVQTGSDAFPITYIRGIGSNDSSIGAEPSIGVYIDGVYASRLGGALTDLLDIERVEVLKGPQGTLFGRNSIGGAISIITKKPDDEFNAKLKAEFSSFNTMKTSAVVNSPLAEDSLYVRAFASKSTSDGWQENTLSDENGYQQDRLNTGVKLTWFATDSVEVNFSTSWSEYDDTAGYVENLSSIFPGMPEASILDDEKVVNGGFDAFGNSVNNQPVNVPLFQRELAENWLNVSWDISENVNFTSLTTIRDYTTTSSREYDGTEYFIGENVLSIEDSESFGQEFRFSSETDKLFWVAGTSFHKEEATLDFTLKFLDVGLLQGMPLNMGAPFTEQSLTAATTESVAIFGDVNYKFSDAMSVTVGARYSEDEKSMDYNNGLHAEGAALLGGFGMIVPTPYQFVDELGQVDLDATSLVDTWTDFSPRLVVDYKLDNTLYYASITKGYKSGAYNSYPSPDAATYFLVFPEARASVNPELVTNYEVGFKADLLDRDLKLNGSFYHMDYEDLQIFQVIGTLTQLANAGAATSSGLELDGRYFVNQEIAVLFNASWMDTEYDEYMFGDIDYSGTELLYSPNFSGSLTLDYETDFSDFGLFNAYVTLSHKGNHLLTQEIEQEAYSVVNAQVSLTSDDDSWKVALFANNLTDEDFLNSISSNLTSFGITGATRNKPRSYGVSVSYNF